MDRLVVEHIFITTMEPAQAISAAGALLTRHRFVVKGRQGFSIGDDAPITTEFVRKRKSQFMRLSNRNFLNRAQKVRIDFDRGRVTVVAVMDDHNSSLEVSSRGGVFGANRRKKFLEMEQNYLAGIANALEASIARRDGIEIADRFITLPMAAVTELAKRQTRNALILLAVIFLVVVGLVTFIVFTSHR